MKFLSQDFQNLLELKQHIQAHRYTRLKYYHTAFASSKYVVSLI